MKKSRYCFAGLCVAMALVLIMAACSVNKVPSTEVKVGVVIPLTGDAAVYGEDIRQGIELAGEDLGSDKPTIIYEDACLASDALKSAQKLILADNVDLIAGVFCIPSVNAIATLTKEKKIPVMMTASVPESLTALKAYVFSPNSAIKDEAYAQADFAFDRLGARTASIVWMNSDFGSSYSKSFEERFTALGGKVLSSEALEFFGADYKSELSKAKSKDPDLLLAVHFGTQMGLILKQSKEIGLKAKIMGTYESEDQYIIDSAKGGAEGLVLSTPVGADTGPAFDRFTEAYRARFNKDPAPIARMAYDGLMLEMAAVKACGKDKDCLEKHILATKGYDGASGVFDMTGDGTGKRTFAFKTVKDGKYELIDKAD